MFRIREIRNAKAAAAYYSRSDSGYSLDAPDLRREVGGLGAAKLGLTGQLTVEQLTNLLNGLHAETGERLTAKLVKDRICGWDFTASLSEGVTVALERGDSRIQDALCDAVGEAVADVEAFTHTRERRGGKHENRQTGNLMHLAVGRAESRPVKADGLPAPDRHVHVVVPNLTFDPEPGMWKAVRMRPVMELRRRFDRRFDMRLAIKMTDLGYAIDTKYRNGRYHTWDIQGLPKSVITKFSWRSQDVETLRGKLGVTDPRSADKLGTTSRQFKRRDMTLEDYRRVWDAKVVSSHLTDAEKGELSSFDGTEILQWHRYGGGVQGRRLRAGGGSQGGQEARTGLDFGGVPLRPDHSGRRRPHPRHGQRQRPHEEAPDG